MADRVYLLQLDLADRLDKHYADAPMTQRLAEAQALIVSEAAYGPGTYSEQVEHHLVAGLPNIEDGDTRGEYAARLRLIAQGVTP
ncbi:hypothetical protein ACFXHD_10795 [Streptomyces hydrogenans]|uniref:hypothetical protein n=1 Tax=Streptomyces hydrogenans TaxID=1873719 RepID=UPI00368EA470